MREFMLTLHLRIHDAITAMRRAHAVGDDDLALSQAGEVENLVEIAARHGIDLGTCYQSLAPTG